MRVLTVLLSLLLLASAAPDPNNLNSNWWELFKENPSDSLEETRTRLTNVADSLTGEDKEEAESLVSQTLANLDEWNTLRSAQPATAASPPPLAPAYTFDQLLELGHQYTGAQQTARQTAAELATWTERSASVQQERGRVKLEYADSEPNTTKRLILGLQIMQLRSQQALFDQRQRLASSGQKAAEAAIQGLRLRLGEAFDRTSVAPEKRQELGNQLAQAKQALATYRRNNPSVDDPKGDQLQIALIQAQAEQALADLLDGRSVNSAISDRLTSLREQLKRMTPDARADTAYSKANEAIAIVQFASEHYVPEQASWLDRTFSWWTKFHAGATKVLNYSLVEIYGVPVTPAKLLKAVLVILLATVISMIIRAIFRRWGKKKGRFAPGTLYSISRMIHYGIILLAILFALGVLGLGLNELLIIIGALSIGIGLGLQKVAANFVAGLALILGHKIKVGDYLELETGELGQIKSIHFQHSVVRTFDGRDIILPNAQLTDQAMTNWTMQDPYYRLTIPFTVAYGTDKDLVAQVALAAADRVPITLKNHRRVRDPNVRIKKLGDNGIEFELVVWINFRELGRYIHTISLYLWEIETGLRERGIQIPFPQRTLHFPEDQDQ